MGNTTVPIVMAANDVYAPYLGVSMQSMCNHFSKKNQYQIFVLQEDISEIHKKKIKRQERENVRIEFVDVTDIFDKIKIPTIGHLSKETAYRLIIGKLFSEYKKILYVDSDTIILRDLAELYNLNINNYILGVVRARLFKGSYEYIVEQLKIVPEKYFNAGVLLINNEALRTLAIGEKGLSMLKTGKYVCQDQDVLNILCEDKVMYIDGRWNVEWEHLTGLGGEPIIDDTRVGTLEMLDDPYIVHFTTRIKPWMRPDIKLAEYFWEEARKSCFYEEILYQNLDSQSLFSLYLFPWSEVEPNSRIILYGYGKVGSTLYSQILKTKYCRIVAVADKKADEITGLTIPVIFTNEIISQDYDTVIICVEQKKVADTIKRELLELGVNGETIRWKSPINGR